MNIWNVDFGDLYQRHLCRHSQLGINVWHVVAVYGVYFSLCALAAASVRGLLPQMPLVKQCGVLLLLSLPYFAILRRNIPARVFLLTVASTMFLILAAVWSSDIPFWLHLILIPAWHRVQVLSHRSYTPHHEMSAFEGRYRKGGALSLLPAVYELPILLQYLAFGRKDWVR